MQVKISIVSFRIVVGIINIHVDPCIGSAIPPRVDDPSPFIVGGFETSVEDNPWQIALLLYSSLRCGGSIISDRWILSAAHCTM